MGYVWTAEQIESYESYYREVSFHFNGVAIEFTTTDDFVRGVLPPCLQPPDKPSGLVSITQGRESWQGAFTIADEESIGAIYLDATRDGQEGLYSLTVIVDGDMNVTTGRESWGMPKKRGESNIFSDGEALYAYSERRGTRLIEIDATLGERSEPFVEHGRLYELKGWIAPDGGGLHDDPYLVVFDTQTSYSEVREAEGSLRLTGTLEDPVGDIPVVSIDHATFLAGVEEFVFAEEVQLKERDTIKPFIYGRAYDNWTEPIKRTADTFGALRGRGAAAVSRDPTRD
jgi:acetoacetate decarboxylase